MHGVEFHARFEMLGAAVVFRGAVALCQGRGARADAVGSFACFGPALRKGKEFIFVSPSLKAGPARLRPR